MLRAVGLNMGSDAPRITDPRYDRYFKQGSAAAGVAGVIAAGRFRINGLPIPASEADFRRLTPQGYTVNQVTWLAHDAVAGTWKGGYRGQGQATSYDAAALAVATGIVAGLEVRLYDSDGDRYVDAIEADYQEGVQVQTITHNADGTLSVRRGAIDGTQRTAGEGRRFDAERFTATSDERISAQLFDPTIRPGDVALFWWGPQGWAMRRAREVHGVFVGGQDHKTYTIDGHSYADAMRFSRDNLIIANRPGEFVNAQKFFGLNNNAEGRRVSLWLVPTTDPMSQGAPVAMTSGVEARAFLAQAIAQARGSLATAVPSVDGSDVAPKAAWVSSAIHQQLQQAIVRAEATLQAASSSNGALDYQTYLLYLALNGSSDDIGAKYAGYQWPGFLRAIQHGRNADGQP
ncbi:MAG: hypothetical protein CFE41_16945 [Burkholderiales bacterium PBB2]|nr:MAG: hypothetical protein CFE41_16945 [Burkholderiales bacterium PBB2]